MGSVSFDDSTVRGTSVNPGLMVALSFKSRYEIGYSSNSTLTEASMKEDAGLDPEDGFSSAARMFYVKGNWSIGGRTAAYILIGRSTVEVEGTSTTVCLFFCDDVITLNTTTDYRSKESGTAVGLGLQWRTKQKRRLTLEYVDYVDDSRFDFSGVYLGYRWLFDIPIAIADNN